MRKLTLTIIAAALWLSAAAQEQYKVNFQGAKPNIADFASRHDVVLFVSGRKSSNGRVLFAQSLSKNARSYHIERAEEIDMSWLDGVDTVGICGATSTPKWLMEECRDYINMRIKHSATP